MKSTLLDLSEKIEPTVIDAIAAVATVAEQLGIPFLIVGAAARDFLLEYGCGIKSGRATEDVDFGVQVHAWEEYERLVSVLQNSAGFIRDNKKRHRFHAPNSLLIDLVPFGPIAGRDQQIIWPLEENRAMSVEGFDSAMSAAVEVLLRVDPRLFVRTASLPGLALLKIISWEDGYPIRARDAHDFYLIVNSYMETADIDRLGTDARDLVIESIPSLQDVGARLLGRDMASIADASTARHVEEILHREQEEEGNLRLVVDVLKGAVSSTGADEVLALIRAVAQGFSEVAEAKWTRPSSWKR